MYEIFCFIKQNPEGVYASATVGILYCTWKKFWED
jgi:hypothetical protein